MSNDNPSTQPAMAAAREIATFFANVLAEHHIRMNLSGDDIDSIAAIIDRHFAALRADLAAKERALEVERAWVRSLTNDNGVLLQAADGTKAGSMVVSQAGIIEQLQSELVEKREEASQLRTALQEAHSFINAVGTEDPDDVETMATIEQLSGRITSALSANTANKGEKNQ